MARTYKRDKIGRFAIVPGLKTPVRDQNLARIVPGSDRGQKRSKQLQAQIDRSNRIIAESALGSSDAQREKQRIKYNKSRLKDALANESYNSARHPWAK
jgi:hypothetical protein